MAIVLWSGLRQIEAIRSAFFVSLTQGGATLAFRTLSFEDLSQWVIREGLNPDWLLQKDESIDDLAGSRIEPVERFQMVWSQAILHECGVECFTRMHVESTRTTSTLEPSSDYGPERSSANWDRWENFLTTSAMLRFMAALEQFEIDALKALFYYRPQGRGVPKDEHVLETVEESVIFETPEKKSQVEHYQFPPLWTWIRQSAENNYERRKIFSRVYEIEFPSPKFGKKYGELCDMRNAIAHGRSNVNLTVFELVQIHCYVASTMLTLRAAILERYRLEI